MHDELHVASPPAEAFSRGIFLDDSGRYSVGSVEFATFDDARDYLLLSAQQASTARMLLDTDAAIERLMATRELLRAQAADITCKQSQVQVRPDGDALEDEWQHFTSALAVESRKAEPTVSNQLQTAQQRSHELPATLLAWQEGHIHSGHVFAIERIAATIEPEQRSEFELLVLSKAAGRTPQQLSRIGHRIAKRFEAMNMHVSHEEAFDNRGVWITPEDNGMATVHISTSAVLADAIIDRLRRAYKRKSNDTSSRDPRGLHQFMSDTAAAVVLTGMCDAGWLDNVRAEVVVTMPATMLSGSASGEAELPAGQLIDDDTAMMLAGNATSLTRLFTDPVSGVVVTADVYQPSASLRRFIQHRDRTCRFPGCSRIAHHADVDHTVDWQFGGKTTPDNLACLCRHHHTLKHRLGPEDGWRVKQVSPGVLEWTDPHGRVRRTAPEPVTPRVDLLPDMSHPEALAPAW